MHTPHTPLPADTLCPPAALLLAIVAGDSATAAALARLTPALAAAARLRSRTPRV